MSQLKRQHSAEPLTDPAGMRKSPHLKSEDSAGGDTPKSVNSTTANAGTPPDGNSPIPAEPPEVVGSPFKRHRASIQDISGSMMGPLGSNTNDFFPASVLGAGPSNNGTPPSILGAGPSDSGTPASSAPEVKLEAKADSDEEL